MPAYTLFGSSLSLFDAWTSTPLTSVRLYSTSTQFGILNADGSKTYFIGTGLVWDPQLAKFTGGTIERITHYTNGAFTDQLTGLNLSAVDVQAAFEQAGSTPETLRSYFFSGNDVFDARYRVDDKILPVKFIGYGGNDLIYGGKGENEFWGYSGQDSINGGSGKDFINGGGDNDTIQGAGGDDRLVGDGGADQISGGAGNDAIYAGAGNDAYLGGAGTDTAVYYRSFYDLVITATTAGFQVIEPNGQDMLTDIEQIAADEGSFAFNTATGTWELLAPTPGVFLIELINKVEGTESADVINLTGLGRTNAISLDGDDSMTGTSGWDLLIGGDGGDVLSGETSAYTTKAGQDRLYGESGNDQLLGMGGTDLIYGGGGRDTISGGNGNDTITGGAAADTFVFRYATDPATKENWNTDIINDFQLGLDKIELQFGPWAPGTEPEILTPALSLTSAGWKLALPDAGSILLKGVFAAELALADILA